MIQKDQVEVTIRTHHRTKLKLHVPSLPPSNLQHCGIIELKYVIAKVNVCIKPISIPISRFTKSSGKVTDLSRISLSNFNESQLTKNQPIEWNMYESKESKVHEDDNDSNSQSFSPKYPVFHFINSHPPK
ncbi:hypothetical protein HZH68_005106 [Vespula germanica]|uniref:Arrestin C-terminal-like domain-containing protein n=1 Tax=Vespula germanica TaxID=30212 RepID=A0A834NDY3_VESGE|nr:hypothetical protein HZH68_005106 [Vespula germanica]